MIAYRNISGDSGVEDSTGASNIAEMQRLAKLGRGLCSFINRVIRNRYARKLG